MKLPCVFWHRDEGLRVRWWWGGGVLVRKPAPDFAALKNTWKMNVAG